MLIRFIVGNLFSFNEAQEFNMLPASNKKSMKHHIIEANSTKVLKLSSIYGANGAGKSNLIKAIALLQDLVLERMATKSMEERLFKLNEANKDKKQLLAVEFCEKDKNFLYALEVCKGVILTEELYIINKKDHKEILLFERKTNSKNNTMLKFNPDFEKDEKNLTLKKILEVDFYNPNALIFKYLTNRGDSYFDNIRQAYSWFEDSLNIIYSHSEALSLIPRIEKDKRFAKFIEKSMCSLDVGIKSIVVNKDEIDSELLPSRMREKLNISENNSYPISTKMFQMIEKEKDGKTYLKSLAISHAGENNYINNFSLEEESDGTQRLLHILPIFDSITYNKKVFLIDELERSIHPSLIKKLIGKLSNDTTTQGQLIFTTHESNLLDQTIFSQDEIWFAEKDSNGATTFITLNDFKEHKTIDIRKGYLSGRYGGIPFLGNLEELHWGLDADKE